MKQKAKMNIII